MDTKPNLICLEPVDPQSLTRTDSYVKQEIVYTDPRNSSSLVQDKEQIFYTQNNISSGTHYPTKTSTNTSAKYLLVSNNNFISESPKPPKLRLKSIYNNQPKLNTVQMSNITPPSLQQEPQEMINGLVRPDNMISPNTISNSTLTITPNPSFVPRTPPKYTWTAPAETGTPGVSTNEHILPDMGYVSTNETSVSTFELMNATSMTPTLNFISVMTPNGPVLISANPEIADTNSKQVLSVVDNVSVAGRQSVADSNTETLRVNTHQSKKSTGNSRRRKPPKTNNQPQLQSPGTISASLDTNGQILMSTDTVTGQILNPLNTSTVVYTQEGPVYIINQEQPVSSLDGLTVDCVSNQDPVQSPVPLIPQKGTVIEEPPKVQPGYRTADRKVKDIGYGSGNSSTMESIECTVAEPDELDLDAALTVFKIYK